MLNPFKQRKARMGFSDRTSGYRALISARIDRGFPILVGVTHYSPPTANTYWEEGDPEEFDFEILTKEGRPAPKFVLEKFFKHEDKYSESFLSLFKKAKAA